MAATRSSPERHSVPSTASGALPAADSPVGSRPRVDWWAVAVFGVAAGLRVLYALQYAGSPLAGIELADQSYYRNWAMSIASGDWPGTAAFEQGPLYAYLLAAAYVTGLPDTVVLAVQMGLGAGMCVLVYACGLRLFRPPAARIAGFLAALYGPFVFYECMLMKSFLSPILTCIVLYAGLRYADKVRPIWLALAGAAIGLACLNREVYALLLIPMAVWTLRQPRTDAPQPSGTAWAHLAILVVSLAAVVLPATLRNRAVTGEFVVVTSGGGEVFYMAHGPFATGNYEPPPFVRGNPFVEHDDFRKEAQARAGRPLTHGESSRFWFREGLRHMWSHPLRAVRLTAVKAVNLFNDFEVPDSQNYEATRELVPILSFLPSFGWLVGIGFLGIALSFGDVHRYQLPLGIVAAQVVGVLLSYNFGRFRAGMVPVWILFAAYGLSWLAAQWKPSGRSARLHGVLGTAVAVLLTLAAFLPPLGVDTDRLAAERHKLRQTLAQMSEWRSAATDIQQRVEANPQDARAHRMLGESLLLVGRFHEARRHCEEAIRLAPGDSRAYLSLGDAFARLKRYDDAVEQYERSLAMNRDDAAAHARLGSLYVSLDRYEQAAPHFRDVVRIQPASANARINLGLVCARLCRPAPASDAEHDWCAEAVAQFREALRLEPASPQASRELAHLLFRLGETDQAVELLDSAIENHPDLIEPEPLIELMLGDGQDSLDADRTIRLAGMLERMARAAAEQSRFRDAVRLQRTAVRAAESAQRFDLARSMATRLDSYESHRLDTTFGR